MSDCSVSWCGNPVDTVATPEGPLCAGHAAALAEAHQEGELYVQTLAQAARRGEK